MKPLSIQAAHVDFIPKELEEGVLYISKKFSTAAHRCFCGCGTRIVTPLRPTEYALIEQGGLVSLHPSIGNWNHPCQSHYWIRENRVLWAGPMTQGQIRSGRAYDDALKDAYFSNVQWPWWRRAMGAIQRWIDDLFG